jgi:hypothetical protein
VSIEAQPDGGEPRVLAAFTTRASATEWLADLLGIPRASGDIKDFPGDDAGARAGRDGASAIWWRMPELTGPFQYLPLRPGQAPGAARTAPSS